MHYSEDLRLQGVEFGDRRADTQAWEDAVHRQGGEKAKQPLLGQTRNGLDRGDRLSVPGAAGAAGDQGTGRCGALSDGGIIGCAAGTAITADSHPGGVHNR